MKLRMVSVMVIVVLVCAGWVGAVIKVDMPVSKVYGAANPVLVGKVIGVKKENRVVEAEVVEVVKGVFGQKTFRVQIAQPEELIGKVAVGEPMVVFVGRAIGGAAAPVTVHVADTWLLAERVAGTEGLVLRAVQEKRDQLKSFPGRSPALVEIVRQIKTGKSTLADVVENKVFTGGIKEMAKLPVEKASQVLQADVNGDGKMDLVVVAGKVRLFLGGEKGFLDGTEKWGLNDVNCTKAAVGDLDGDGKVDLVAAGKVWMNKGDRFVAGEAVEDGNALALAVVKGEVVVVSKNGEVFRKGGKPVKLWDEKTSPQDGAIGYWGDDERLYVMAVDGGGVRRYALDGDGAAADIERLTGEQLSTFKKLMGGSMEKAKGVATDVDGDGREDYLVYGEGGMAMLVNRGFGAYLVNPDVAESLKGGEMLKKGAVCVAGKRAGEKAENLVMVTEEGAVIVAENAGAGGEK